MNGWENIGGTWYYFDGAGYMMTGWQWINNSWYYLHPNDQWQRISGLEIII